MVEINASQLAAFKSAFYNNTGDDTDDPFVKAFEAMGWSASSTERRPSGDPDPWLAQDLIPGRAYESIHFGTVTYVGIDFYCGESTHQFQVGRMQSRYWKTEKLGEFLKPKRPSELLQAARAVVDALFQTPEHVEAMRRLRAAVESLS
ncbi:hypothetical protein [Rhizobium leguminosarum]|uniref:hypothetical protein n=1 Tax=Rhizobium leguminosarum TaxID=384 RepID=UPI0014411459|nr:hypothetical protein [Rhizobium leguminosarum]MDH6273638.1 hypothetical protein [Rhizobium leguminosarum]NKK01012.1 hypothetical protein [Rhizobium leguminosarum bv. viciae]NKK87287.1 hypothetical protein [Rhizobium leguminosarum bv. viciae]